MPNREKFIEDLFITCDECGYNNLKNRFVAFGTCLRCGKIIDDRTYFRATMIKIARMTPRSRRKGNSRALLYF